MALDKVSSKTGLKPSNLHQNSYKHVDSWSHLNLLSLKYVYIIEIRTFKFSFERDFVQKAFEQNPNPFSFFIIRLPNINSVYWTIESIYFDYHGGVARPSPYV